MEELLEIPEKVIEVRHDCSEIIRISGAELSFGQFFNNFMYHNVPVIIKNVNLLTPISKQWFIEDKKLNIDALEKILGGDLQVPVYNCSKQFYNSHEKITMTFRDYANYWRNRQDLLYLKDFHLKEQLPHIDFYNIPHFFASDWLNEYLLDKAKDDYRFVYIGVEGTWTPLHADVFNSYSWSGNVCGRKRWFILYPGEELKLKDNFGQLPSSVDEALLRDRNIKYFDIIQEPNEILFVPSRWYHQVFNLTDVFSINHNWFNSCNVHFIKESLLKNFEDVKAEIQDCSSMENFEEHCQIMLKSLFGMNFEEFVDLLIHIGTKRMRKLKLGERLKLFNKYDIGNNLVRYDTEKIQQILKELLNVDYLNENLKLKIEKFLHTNNLN